LAIFLLQEALETCWFRVLVLDFALCSEKAAPLIPYSGCYKNVLCKDYSNLSVWSRKSSSLRFGGL